ncbi:MAG: hypothetical protein HC933_00735 [Pleurocapsa sp. SU_196_0]|nr:hypothetical protein [Pleurocapsa sp. SU_196_0]
MKRWWVTRHAIQRFAQRSGLGKDCFGLARRYILTLLEDGEQIPARQADRVVFRDHRWKLVVFVVRKKRIVTTLIVRRTRKSREEFRGAL